MDHISPEDVVRLLLQYCVGEKVSGKKGQMKEE